MGTLERRARARVTVRTKILDAARELFVRDGVEAVSMRAIAKKIEYTPTTIYHHFRDKHALLLQLCTIDMQSLAHAFQSIGRIEDPAERVRRLGQAYVDFGIDHPGIYRFLFMTPKPDVLAAEEIAASPEQNAYLMLLSTVREGIEAGRYRPEFDDPHQLAQLLWGGLHGIVSLHIAKEHDSWIEWRNPRETARAMIDVMTRGTLRGPRD
jgi:AcrR family transcriptional regulator